MGVTGALERGAGGAGAAVVGVGVSARLPHNIRYKARRCMILEAALARF